MKLIKKGTIPASYCDSDVKLSVVGAFSMIEDLVTEMMGELKVDGLICRKEYGAMWVFVRNRMELRRDLYWKDEYTKSEAKRLCWIQIWLKSMVMRQKGLIVK